MKRLLTEIEKAEIIEREWAKARAKILKLLCASMSRTRLMKAESRGSMP